ncbi:MAG: hypothetical protein HON94_10130 [Methylococcales bacterium]|nr:hypothetical protein [Methylococcales bacterium]
MYTDEDLNNAVEQGIFTETAVKDFRSSISQSKHSPAVDEENFKLISGFNDIFVVIACAILLISSAWVGKSFNTTFAMSLLCLLSWGLSEFFVLKRQMALPAIMLLIAFVGSVFSLSITLAGGENGISFAAAASAVAAWLHWRRFKVPITVVAGVAATLALVISVILSAFPSVKNYLLILIFLAGAITFFIAMAWDSADRERLTRNSDIAFWLHLLAGPLIVHPIFSSLTILQENTTLTTIVAIVLIYLLLTLISLIIDRRILMVSSLIYVLYAVNQLLETVGHISDSIAISGIIISFSLLLLSGFWHKLRHQLIKFSPEIIQSKVPPI